MSNVSDLSAARSRARARRSAGVAADFDPQRLTLARRLAGLKRTEIASAVGVTPAAITQYEKGVSRPALPVVDQLARTLEVAPEFFRLGNPIPPLDADGAHFRSLRSTTAIEREGALAFAELALVVFEAVQRYVELPPVKLADLDVPSDLGAQDAIVLAREARKVMGVQPGPVPNMVRLLEAHGIAVVELGGASHRVDAFSHRAFGRPIVVLNSFKGDKARRRFDCAHELGHLVMHHDTEPGSKLVEAQAHSFAAEFLAPSEELGAELPRRLDWPLLHELKKRWGMSLKALIVQAFKLEHIGEATYRRGMKQLSAWGLPEPGALGPPESPVVLPRVLELLEVPDSIDWLTRETGLPSKLLSQILESAGGEDRRPAVQIDFP